jgi:hypothetical protein
VRIATARHTIRRLSDFDRDGTAGPAANAAPLCPIYRLLKHRLASQMVDLLPALQAIDAACAKTGRDPRINDRK